MVSWRFASLLALTLLGGTALVVADRVDGAAVDAGEVHVGFSTEAQHYHGRPTTGGPPACNVDSPTFLMRGDAPGAVPSCEMLYGGANGDWGASYLDPVLGAVSGPCYAYAEPTAPGPCDGWADGDLEWRPIPGASGYVVTGPAETASSVLVRSRITSNSGTRGDLVIEHELVASPDPRMAEVEIRVTNPLDIPIADVHYRRMFGHLSMTAGPPPDDPSRTWEPSGTRSHIFLGGDFDGPPDTVECTSNNPWTGAAPQPGDCFLARTQYDMSIAPNHRHCRDTQLPRGPVVPGPGTITGPGEPWTFFPQGLEECGTGFLWQFDLGTLPPRETRTFRYYIGATTGGLPASLELLDLMPENVEFWGVANPVNMSTEIARSLVIGWAGLSPPVPSLEASVPVPAWSASIPAPFVAGTTLCAGDTATFSGSVVPGTHAVTSTMWDFGDGDELAGPPGGSDATHTYPEIGIYVVRLTAADEGGWVRTASLDLQVVSCNIPPLPVIVSASSPGTCTDTSVQFVGSSSDPDGGTDALFVWAFGDGQVATGPNVTHQYLEDGPVTVRLTVTDDDPGGGLAAAVTLQWEAMADYNCLPELHVPVHVLATRAGGTFDVTGLATDADDVPAVLLASAPGGSLVTSPDPAGTAAQYHWQTEESTPPGLYMVRLTATDGKADATQDVDLLLVVLPRPAPDVDHDGVSDITDNCPVLANRGQQNGDDDGVGDVCDVPAPTIQTTVPAVDSDRDGIADGGDNCVMVPNADQTDFDLDGVGDACDADQDGDGVPEQLGAAPDNCPGHPNVDQTDRDHDRVGDACQPILGADQVVQVHATPTTRARSPIRSTSGDSSGWGLGLVAGVALLAGLLGGLLARARPGFWVAAFSRLANNRLLDHPVRSHLLEVIRANPGIHFTALARAVSKSRGTVEHHLHRMVAAGLVQVQSTPGFQCYWPAQHNPHVSATSLKAPVARHVLAKVRAHPGQSILEVAGGLGVSHSVASYHVRRLRDAGLITTEREGKALRLFPTTDAASIAVA